MDSVTIGGATLYHGDCLEVMASLPDSSFDAIVTDPPYGISHPCDFKSRGRSMLAKNKDYHDVIGDCRPFDPQPLLGLDVPTILWGANHFASRLPDSGGWLVWDKERPDDLDQATCELAWTNCVKGVRRFRHLWNGCMKASQRGEAYHPTEKPVALMAWCLSLRWTKGFRAILDPYMGSGTTGVACVRSGRKFVGIELDKRYLDTACERIQREVDSAKAMLPFAGSGKVKERSLL